MHALEKDESMLEGKERRVRYNENMLTSNELQ
jgi:hypothetical protein